MIPDYSTCQGIEDTTDRIECMMDQQVIDQMLHQDDPVSSFKLTTPTMTVDNGMSDRSWMVDSPPRTVSWWEGMAFEDKIIILMVLIIIVLIIITTLVKLLQKGKHNDEANQDGVDEGNTTGPEQTMGR